MAPKLALADIAEPRAYEREREEFRDRIIALKKLRRVPIGPFVTLVFENRDTMRFQIQEMARAEKLLSDEQIQVELDVYNALIPEPGELSATLFIELTSEAQLREWLPKLVGIETAIELRIGGGEGGEVVMCRVDPDHEGQLTRAEVTAAVHYVRFALSSRQIDRFASEPVVVAVAHPGYVEGADLSAQTRAELLQDLRP